MELRDHLVQMPLVTKKKWNLRDWQELAPVTQLVNNSSNFQVYALSIALASWE